MIPYEDCVHLEQVGNVTGANGEPTPLFKCNKGHLKCQESVFSERCPDFETECDVDCIHYYCDYRTFYDDEGCPYDEDISICTLGHSAIEDASFCKYYVERDY